MTLPQPDSEALAYSEALKRRISEAIEAAGGWIGFDCFMDLALYAPGMGYYSGGARKFGADGDFVTAPEISSAFSQTLGAQAVQVMALSAPRIIEVGAGSGRLAADLLLELEARGTLPERYSILELSGELRGAPANHHRRAGAAFIGARRLARPLARVLRWAGAGQ